MLLPSLSSLPLFQLFRFNGYWRRCYASALFTQCLIKIIVALCRMHTKRTPHSERYTWNTAPEDFAHYSFLVSLHVCVFCHCVLLNSSHSGDDASRARFLNHFYSMKNGTCLKDCVGFGNRAHIWIGTMTSGATARETKKNEPSIPIQQMFLAGGTVHSQHSLRPPNIKSLIQSVGSNR